MGAHLGSEGGIRSSSMPLNDRCKSGISIPKRLHNLNWLIL